MPTFRFWTILALLAIPALLPAQELIFCLDHTKAGEPLAKGHEFDLDRFGQELDLLFRNDGPIASTKLYFFIDELDEKKFVEYDTKSHVPIPGSEWASIRYRFEASGTFRVLVLNENKEEICRSQVVVNVLEEENSPEYYDGVRLVFCNEAPDGVPDTLLSDLAIPTGGERTLTMFLRHIRPFDSHRLYVDVWAGSGSGDGLYVETLEFKVDPAWLYTQFSYTFRSPGIYTFRIYNENEIWMTTGRLSVMIR